MNNTRTKDKVEIQISKKAHKILSIVKKRRDKSLNIGVAASLLGVAAQIKEPSRAKLLISKIKELL